MRNYQNKMSRIAELIKLLMRAKKMGAKLNGKSVIERELSAWINQPEKQV